MTVTEVRDYMCNQCKRTYPTYSQAAACSDTCTLSVKWEGGAGGTVHFGEETT